MFRPFLGAYKVVPIFGNFGSALPVKDGGNSNTVSAPPAAQPQCTPAPTSNPLVIPATVSPALVFGTPDNLLRSKFLINLLVVFVVVFRAVTSFFMPQWQYPFSRLTFSLLSLFVCGSVNIFSLGIQIQPRPQTRFLPLP